MIHTGQMALSVYTGHIILGMTILKIMGEFRGASAELAAGCTIVFYFGSVVFAWLWRKKFERGPVDWLMRKIAG